ncbi:MAG: Flp pilus assembly protein CpaB [Coriobacteriia bacterium]|nr:Flp pilus assembly protein CpaB [Coriobacteriia bacterium]
MNHRKRLLISIICGVLAALCLGLFLYRTSTATAREQARLFNRFGGTTVQVCVANRTIQPGEKITDGAVTTEEWPSVLLPDDPILDSERHKAVGNSASTVILPGEPLRSGRIDATPIALDSVPLGMQAITIPTDPIRALGGQIRPGMRVDVLCSSGRGDIELLVQGVEVLALSNARDYESATGNAGTSQGLLGGRAIEEIRWVTLCIPQENVQQIVAAASEGKVYLTFPGETLGR